MCLLAGWQLSGKKDLRPNGGGGLMGETVIAVMAHRALMGPSVGLTYISARGLRLGHETLQGGGKDLTVLTDFCQTCFLCRTTRHLITVNGVSQ